jgi:hypothetical protein
MRYNRFDSSFGVSISPCRPKFQYASANRLRQPGIGTQLRTHFSRLCRLAPLVRPRSLGPATHAARRWAAANARSRLLRTTRTDDHARRRSTRSHGAGSASSSCRSPHTSFSILHMRIAARRIFVRRQPSDSASFLASPDESNSYKIAWSGLVIKFRPPDESMSFPHRDRDMFAPARLSFRDSVASGSPYDPVFSVCFRQSRHPDSMIHNCWYATAHLFPSPCEVRWGRLVCGSFNWLKEMCQGARPGNGTAWIALCSRPMNELRVVTRILARTMAVLAAVLTGLVAASSPAQAAGRMFIHASSGLCVRQVGSPPSWPDLRNCSTAPVNYRNWSFVAAGNWNATRWSGSGTCKPAGASPTWVARALVR